jgi:drug/metabolite transporter (DMT)-like permease
VIVVFALGAALVNAIASFLQRLGVEDAPRASAMSGGLITHMLRRPVWVLGFACMGGGFVLQALALHNGALAVVQPLITTEMLFVVLILWGWYREHVRSRDWVYSVCTVGGLATFLTVLAPTSAGHDPRTDAWITAIAVIVGAMIVLVVISLRGPAWWRALLLGAAASVGFAMTAALTKSFSDAFSLGVVHVLSIWQTYALCVVGLASFLLMQNAFHAGPFAASQSTLILVNPFVSVGLGAWLYGEPFPHGAGVVALGLIAVAVFVAGAVGLCTSPLIAGVHGSDDEFQLLAGKGLLARHLAARHAPV